MHSTLSTVGIFYSLTLILSSKYRVKSYNRSGLRNIGWSHNSVNLIHSGAVSYVTDLLDAFSTQIKVLQERLESLKKEKHSLFQQLKLVLHHEDEKKKQEDQKLYGCTFSQFGVWHLCISTKVSIS